MHPLERTTTQHIHVFYFVFVSHRQVLARYYGNLLPPGPAKAGQTFSLFSQSYH